MLFDTKSVTPDPNKDYCYKCVCWKSGRCELYNAPALKYGQVCKKFSLKEEKTNV